MLEEQKRHASKCYKGKHETTLKPTEKLEEKQGKYITKRKI
jgi:hypothetical protein